MQTQRKLPFTWRKQLRKLCVISTGTNRKENRTQVRWVVVELGTSGYSVIPGA